MLPDDADMLERVQALVQQGQLQALFVPQHTCLYNNATKKGAFLAAVAAGADTTGLLQQLTPNPIYRIT